MAEALQEFILSIANLPEATILQRAEDREVVLRAHESSLERLRSYAADPEALQEAIKKKEDYINSKTGEIKLILRIRTHVHGKTFVTKNLRRFVDE